MLKEVSIFIDEKIICKPECLQRILLDRRSHFRDKLIMELIHKFQIRHGFYIPYHLKTNRLMKILLL